MLESLLSLTTFDIAALWAAFGVGFGCGAWFVIIAELVYVTARDR